MQKYTFIDEQKYLTRGDLPDSRVAPPLLPASLIWPECFVTGDLPEGRSDAQLCADALTAWAHCHAGKELSGEIPEKFGEVMVKIANRLGVTGTPESFSEWSQRWLEENR